MPRARWSIVVCALTIGLGCEKLFTFSDHPAARSLAKPLESAIPANALVVESILLERPLGDAFLDRKIWNSTLVTWAPEKRELLSRNGIQAGVLTGNFPPELLDILSNKAEVVDPHLMTFNNRKEAVIPTAGPIEECKFEFLNDLAGKNASVSLKQARCGILVRPERLADGKIRLHCEPQIQHGRRLERFRPSEDGTQFTMLEEIPTEAFETLGFEVDLRPEECLVVGCIADDQAALGPALFGVEANGHPRQRVVAIRARMVNASPTADLPTIATPGRRPTTIPSQTGN